MKDIYFEVYFGHYLSGISKRKKEISYSLSEDDRLWFDKEQAEHIEKLLREVFQIQYCKKEDKEFVELLQDYLAKGIIDEDYLEGCYKCYK